MNKEAKTPSVRNEKKSYGRSSSHRTTGRDQTSDA